MAFPEDMTGKVICGTGHRPDRLGGYDGYLYREGDYIDRVRKLFEDYNPSGVITGMAQGWDSIIANVAQSLMIPVHAYVPFPGQESKWPREAQYNYHEILKRCDTVTTLAETYSIEALHARSFAMVDAAEFVLACYDGNGGSGTSRCIDYAMKQNKPTLNVYNYVIRPKEKKET